MFIDVYRYSYFVAQKNRDKLFIRAEQLSQIERDRQIDRERDLQIDRERDRQIDRERDRQIDR